MRIVFFYTFYNFWFTYKQVKRTQKYTRENKGLFTLANANCIIVDVLLID